MPVQAGYFGPSIAASYRAHPPLAKAQHRGIVSRHLVVDPPDLPAAIAQPEAELRLLSRHELRLKSSEFGEGARPHERVSATARDFANWRVPLDLAQPIINRSIRVLLAPPSTNDGDVCALRDECH